MSETSAPRIFTFLMLINAAQYIGASVITSDDGLQDYEPRFLVGCYFPAEFQGEFVMQVSGRAGSVGSIDNGENAERRGPTAAENELVQYSSVNITYNAIPVWGYCRKRFGDNVLLTDRYSGGECIRCFRLLRKSRNVIHVESQDLSRCYTNESGAMASCQSLDFASILYRTKEIGGYEIRNEYCPIAGEYRLKYSRKRGGDVKECNSFSSSIDNCANGSQYHLQLNRCNFDSRDGAFDCLGSWPGGPDGSRYIALLDVTSNGYTSDGPRYRCGLYHVDNKRGKTYLALSADSSCTQDLENSTSGYETFVLSKAANQRKMPDYVTTHLASFPKWAQGLWEESLIVNGTMTFTDLNGYKSFTFVSVESNDETGRYVVYSKDQCQEEGYVCMMMRQRSENVLEFKTGMGLSPVYQSDLCDDSNFDRRVWMTQARLERLVESPCPITGQYTGTITDISGMCAELSSNCDTREIMYFKVSDCQSGQLYEERTYLCLGQWEEKGVMYAYTMRNDTNVSNNECFVGLIVNDEEIYIKEAGDHCIRDIDPKKEGMRLYKKGQCYGNSPSPAPRPLKPPALPREPLMTPVTSTSASTSHSTNARTNNLATNSPTNAWTPSVESTGISSTTSASKTSNGNPKRPTNANASCAWSISATSVSTSVALAAIIAYFS